MRKDISIRVDSPYYNWAAWRAVDNGLKFDQFVEYLFKWAVENYDRVIEEDEKNGRY